MIPNDGWEEEDDDLNFENDDDDAKVDEPTPAITVRTASSDVSAATAAVTDPESNNAGGADGWDDDADLFLEDEEADGEISTPTPVVTKSSSTTTPKDSFFAHHEGHQRPAVHHKPQQQHLYTKKEPTSDSFLNDGWGDEDLDSLGDSTTTGTDVVATTTTTQSAKKPQSSLLSDLEDYLQMIPQLSNSLNAVLQAEYNESPDKAEQVWHYYQSRPGLVEYTLSKELPRLEYTVIPADEDDDSLKVLQNKNNNKAQVAQYLQDIADTSLLPRCANQSLLADLLQVMTGPDRLVRPQYLATAMANQCHFLLDVAQKSVHAQATLHLSLPSSSRPGGRLEIAQVVVSAQFIAPSEAELSYLTPQLFYHIDRTVMVSDFDKRDLQNVVEMLEQLHLPDQSQEEFSLQQKQPDEFRDFFLQQNWLQNSAAGIQSAWQEIESVAGLGNKLKALLPDEDVWAAAAREEEEEHRRRAAANEATARIASQPQSSAASRPKSILGGMLSKLAKSVALPEEDSEMYKDWQREAQASPQRQNAMPASTPKLYNRETPINSSPRPPPQLYRREGPPASAPQNSSPTLYQREVAKEANPISVPQSAALQSVRVTKTSFSHHPAVMFPQPMQQSSSPTDDVVVSDGWDEDDDDVLDEDTEREENSQLSVNDTTAKPSEYNLALTSCATKHVTQTGTTKEDCWVYNPEDGIIPTRKRYVSPRPGPRHLKSWSRRMEK